MKLSSILQMKRTEHMIKPGVKLTYLDATAQAFLIRMQITCRNAKLLTKYVKTTIVILADH